MLMSCRSCRKDFPNTPFKKMQVVGSRFTKSMQVTSMLVLRARQSNNKIQRPGAIIPMSAERCLPPLILSVRPTQSLEASTVFLRTQHAFLSTPNADLSYRST